MKLWGWADSAISIAAREKKCGVLTDDLDLLCFIAPAGAADRQIFTSARAQLATMKSALGVGVT